ncbi:hypothetical protein [Actinomadura sp. 9N215]|uniref:hypothetical protein n=1 Tax=Actinomadura sp. 9N215 TaxID=3375150 RepID=UPI0037B9D6CA
MHNDTESGRHGLHRIRNDLRKGRNLESYVVALASLIFAVLSPLGDLLPPELLWSVLSAGVGLLVYRLTVPDAAPVPSPLGGRSAVTDPAFRERLGRAREVWLLAPSGKNFMCTANRDVLRENVLRRRGGVVRVVVLDPSRTAAVEAAHRQLTGDYACQPFHQILAGAVAGLRRMSQAGTAGEFEFRLLDHNLGFSMVALDPSAPDGVLIVELQGYHNESSSARMHLRLTRSMDEKWYEYWIDQFEQVWRGARPHAADPG